VLYNPPPNPRQDLLWHHCRNPYCKGALAAPTSNGRAAFCCQSCHDSFDRSRCRACERPIVRKNSRKELCDSRRCEAEFRRPPEIELHPTPTFTLSPEQMEQVAALIAIIPPDLSIPPFLKRAAAPPPFHTGGGNLMSDHRRHHSSHHRSRRPAWPTTQMAEAFLHALLT
jgi:hypothetical protein